MARGKHKQRRAAQQARDDRARISELWEQLHQQRAARVAAEQIAADADTIAAQTTTARADAEAAAESRRRQLDEQAATLTRLLAEAATIQRPLQRHWHRLTDAVAIDYFGGGTTGASAMASIILGQDVRLAPGEVHGRNQRMREAVGRARGIDTATDVPSLHDDISRGITAELLTSYVPDDVDELLRDVASDTERQRIDDGDQATLDRLASAAVDCMDAKSTTGASNHAYASDSLSVQLWHPSPWSRHGWLPADHPLGPVTDRATAATWLNSQPRDVRVLTDAEWATLAGRDAAVAAHTHRAHIPTAALPVHPRPVDAVGIRRLHALDLQGRRLVSERDAAVSPGWSGKLLDVADRATRNMLHAAPFWLPPQQTAGYAASEPLPDDDLDDLKLPYPHTLVVCADPLVIEPTDTPDEDESHQYGLLHDGLVEAVRLLRKNLDSWDTTPRKERSGASSPTGTLLNATRRAYWDDPLPLARLIELRGALVEAILFTATDLRGTVGDAIVWCLAIPAHDGHRIVGRVAVPALLSRTGWHTEATNLLAAACWADWHLPASSESEEPGDLLGSRLVDDTAVSAAASAGADVHVLDVRASGSAIKSDTYEPTGRQIRPHLRRGHYRRQHWGPGGRYVKRVRIAPVLVNASRSELDPTVYRLPAAVAHTAADVVLH